VCTRSRPPGRSTSSCSRTTVGEADSTSTRSPRYTASSTSWVTNRIVIPRSRHGRRTRSSRSARVCASTAVNGSSISSISGSYAGARAMATRCCMPPDSCHGQAPAALASPTDARASATSSRRRAPLRSFCLRGSSTFSPTRIHGNRLRPYPWKTNAVPGGGPSTPRPGRREHRGGRRPQLPGVRTPGPAGAPAGDRRPDRRGPADHRPGGHRPRGHRSSTSRRPRHRDTQMSMVSPAARSSSVSTESRWSGWPSTTSVSQVPQVPSVQE
jgi:hypothetical protein